MIEYVDLTQQARQAAADGRASTEMGFNMANKAREYQLQVAQLALQTEHQNLQAQQQALQMQVQGYNFQHQKEQNAYEAQDLPKVQQWQADYLKWNAAGDPTAPFPVPPSDLKSIKGISLTGDMTKQVIESLPMAQNRAFVTKANADFMTRLNQANETLISEGMSDVVLDTNGGVDPKTGKPDPEKVARIMAAVDPINKRKQAQKDALQSAHLGALSYNDPNMQAPSFMNAEERAIWESSHKIAGGVGGQKAQMVLTDLTKQGLIKPGEEAAAQAAVLSGKTSPPADVLKSFNTADDAIVSMDEAKRKIADFNAKYGPDAFNKYVGPINNPVFSATGRFAGLTKPEEQEARAVFSLIDRVKQNYRKGLYGGALTANEQGQFEKLIADPSRSDYLTVAQGFEDALKVAAGNTVRRYKWASDIDPATKRKYAPEVFADAAQPAAASPTVSPSAEATTKKAVLMKNPPVEGESVEQYQARLRPILSKLGL